MTVIFSQGSGDADPVAAADALAHFGWASHLNGEERTERYFKHALEVDPDNVFAHVFWANLYLSAYNYPMDRDNLMEAKSHYAMAMQSKRYAMYKKYVNDVMLLTFLYTGHDGADIEGIKFANTLRKSHYQIEDQLRRYVLYKWSDRVLCNDDRNEQLVKAVLPDELLATFAWLTKDLEIPNLDLELMQKRLVQLTGRK